MINGNSGYQSCFYNDKTLKTSLIYIDYQPTLYKIALL
jgi:hypothetical protein